ncbi:MAG: hypothetical protein PVG14_01975, partial [Anaerolineales bacterium]
FFLRIVLASDGWVNPTLRWLTPKFPYVFVPLRGSAILAVVERIEGNSPSRRSLAGEKGTCS